MSFLPVNPEPSETDLAEVFKQARAARGRAVPAKRASEDLMRVSNPIPFLVFLAFAATGWFMFGAGVQAGSGAGVGGFLGSMFLGWVIGSTFRIAAQWEKALIFRLGRFHTIKGPGPFFMIPFVDAMRTVDTRITTLDIPRQQAITSDNVPVSIDGVIFLKVSNPADAVIRVQEYRHAIRQYAQTALRDVIGNMTLDQILTDREVVGEKIQRLVESETDGWGLEVAAIRIQDIELPEDLKRVMARQAAAEREKRANITKSEGDREAASNLAAAAMTMAESPGALQLRTLQTLDGLGQSSSNTVVLALPVEVMNALKAVPDFAEALSGAKALKAPAPPLSAPATQAEREVSS